MADDRDGRALRGDPVAQDAGGVGRVLPRPLHAVGAGGDGPPVAGGSAGGRGTALPSGREPDGRIDDDGDARGPLAAPRRGRLSPGARAYGAAQRSDRLKIAVPVKGRLREPAVALLEDAGLGPESPGERALAF